MMATTGLRGFLDRFVHPRVAAVVLLGASIWLCSFLVAAIGVVLEHAVENYATAYLLYFYAGLVGLVGIALIAASVLYLVGLYLARDVLGVVA